MKGMIQLSSERQLLCVPTLKRSGDFELPKLYSLLSTTLLYFIEYLLWFGLYGRFETPSLCHVIRGERYFLDHKDTS